MLVHSNPLKYETPRCSQSLSRYPGVGGARGGHSGHLLPGHEPSYGPGKLRSLRSQGWPEYPGYIIVISWLYHGYIMVNEC